MKHRLAQVLLACLMVFAMRAEDNRWSVRMAESEMTRFPEAWQIEKAKSPRWGYTHGLVTKGMLELWHHTGDDQFYDYAKGYADALIDENGRIKTYKFESFNIDNINPGKILFDLYKRTNDPRYKTAMDTLRRQMTLHPRTKEGGFWHKKVYEHQLWLDGIFMASPFLAQYGATFGEPALFDDVVKQITLIARHTYDPKTGLYLHGWDESRKQAWANKKTGCSANFWSRSIGWYAAALVDVLDHLPKDHKGYNEVLNIVQRLAPAILKYQDPKTGVWYQVTDQGARKGNYVESSASALFTYFLAKSINKGYIDKSYRPATIEAYRGMLRQFIRREPNGTYTITNCCAVAGLGGDKRYRDGSYDYYLSEPIIVNDPKSTGSFILAAVEYEKMEPRNVQPFAKPWDHGKLQVSPEGRYLRHEDGTPFFWIGETAWLLPQRTTRDEVEYYLEQCRQHDYNVVQIQTLDKIPSFNQYGQWSMTDGFDFKNIDKKGVYGYWDHIDHIVRAAERKGIYIGFTCVWGTPVQAGQMNVEEAKAYGKFLVERYKKYPNIIWFIGGDIRGDMKPEVWIALAETMRALDTDHLMTFHPRGRTTSAEWFNSAHWLDFNMFQSGHRRYGQRKGDGDYPIEENTEEDNWRFVDRSIVKTPLKPVIDGEPIYEEIPHGLHDPNEVRWNDNDCRRYAYWSVFAGSFGHTYGHNSIMQFYKPGTNASFGATKSWTEALKDPGFGQMKHLKHLMLAFPFFDRIPDQSIIAGTNGERYDRAIATRGADYLMVYNYSNRPMQIDLTKITGAKKKLYCFNPRTGTTERVGEADNKTISYQRDVAYMSGQDYVLIAVDSSKSYGESLMK